MKVNPNVNLCIIGGGRVGSTLGYHFLKSGYNLSAIIEKNTPRTLALKKYFPDTSINKNLLVEILQISQVIFICVQDDEIPRVVDKIEEIPIKFNGKIFVHTSGAVLSHVLLPLKKKGAFAASLHPIYSFSDNHPSKIPMEGVYSDVEGDPEAVTVMEKMISQIGGKTIKINPEQKLPIHLASVFYSNYFIGMAQIAQDILKSSNIPSKNLWDPFLPLIKSTERNLSQSKPDDALTGPLVRGDVETIKRHLEFLKKNANHCLPVYKEIAKFLLKFKDDKYKTAFE